VIAELDALAGVRRDAAQAANPVPLRLLGADVGKLVDPALGVQARDAQVLPLVPLAQMAAAAPCTPAEVRFAGRSCAATAIAQPEPLVSRRSEPVAVAKQLAAERQKLAARLVPQEESPSAGSPDAEEPASSEARLLTLAAGQQAARGRKRSASRLVSER
jgi:hypothetical protein